MELLYKIIRLFRQVNKYGFDVKKTLESKTKEDFRFGDGQLENKFSSAKKIVRPDGQWDNFLPKLEIQKFSWGDSFHCPIYGTENCEQTLKNAKYGFYEEYSERFLGVLAGIRKGIGGSPNTAAEKWRTSGNLLYQFLPTENTKSWEEFHSPDPMTQELLNEAKKYKDDWLFGHDWVEPGIVGDMKKAMKEALFYSPLGVAVYAWQADKNGIYYHPSWATENHWVECYGYVEGQYWKIYDHYDNCKKKVAWNYPFRLVKRYTLEKKNQTQEEHGKNVYQRYLGIHAIRSEVDKGGRGEIYFVTKEQVFFEGWWSNSPWLKERLNIQLRIEAKLGHFMGITEKDFTDLEHYIKIANIPMSGIEALDTINKLNK